jgi:hypothetical protein
MATEGVEKRHQRVLEMNKEFDDYMKKVYFDRSHPGAFGGLNKIWLSIKGDAERPAGLTKKIVTKWLSAQEVYQVYTEPQSDYPTEAIIVEYPDQMWDIDILVLHDERRQLNKNFRYLLGVIDLFSRYVWVRLLKRKTATETAEAFRSILQEGRVCEKLRGDSGQEFLGKAFTQLLKEQQIPYIRAFGFVKANYIERWFRTFQQKYYRYAYHNTTLKFVDAIQDIVRSYNATVHGTTGFRPDQVDQSNTLALYDRVYQPILHKRAREKVNPSLRVGDLVRLSYFKDKFKRGYTTKWTEEVFEVWAVVKSHPPRYKIRDLLQEPILGSHYTEDLKLVNAKDIADINWKIDKIISTRKLKGQKQQSKVRWFGFGPKFDTFVNTVDLKKYPRWQ